MSNEVKSNNSLKIAVATNDNQTVAGHVGRCKSFLVFETDGPKIIDKVIRINSFTNHGKHHGHNHHNLIDGLKDCDALIFNHGGWRLIDDLKAHNINPILTNEVSAVDAVLKYISGDLVISEENVCQEHPH
jgi:predicted Fe-Mo cluster-binding NifX family protein